MKKLLLCSVILAAVCGRLEAAPNITVSGNSVTILGSSQTISLTCTLIDPNNTGNLRSGSNIITVFVTSTTTPGNVATCGPIYGNDVILDGFGNPNTTYYKVQVFTVSGGIVASTPSLQQFYAFTGSGTVDLSTATPLAPSFFTGPSGSVVMPGTLSVTGATSLTNLTVSGTNVSCTLNNVKYVDGTNTCAWAGADIGAQEASACAALPAAGGTINVDNAVVTLTTAMTDCGKPVKLKFGQVNITSSTVAHIILRVPGSGVEGIGEQSIFTVASGVPATTVPILISKSPQNNIQNTYVRNIHMVNQRNTQVGLIRVVQAQESEVRFNHIDCTTNYCVGMEFVDGFSGDVSGNYCQHGSVHGVCFGVTAATQNVDNVTIGANNFDFAGTFAALNYPYNGANATTLDGVVLVNPSHSYSSGPVAKAGITTLNGATAANATTITVTSGAACPVNYPIWFGSPGSTEGNNVVTNVNVNVLTLMFPAQLAHSNGDQVLCGSVGLWINSNTVGVSVDQGHFEGAGFELWCRQCRGLTTNGGVYSIGAAEGGILAGSDGIRLDPVYNAIIKNPVIDGTTNAINATSASGTWGNPSQNVTMDGFTPALGAVLGNTNQGLVNNTGSAGTTLMLRCIGTAPCPYTLTTNSTARADTDINCSGPACQVNIDAGNLRLAALGTSLTFVGGSSGTCTENASSNSGAVVAGCGIISAGTACTNGELLLSAGWQSTGTATVTAVAGQGQTCSWTITTGTTTAANPTVTDTVTNPLPSASVVCEMNIHGGTHTAAAGEGFNQTVLSATAPVFTFNGTPTAGGTTYFVTRRCGP